MAGRPKLTDAEREERRTQDRERLKQASEQLLSSEGWRRWVRLRSRAGLARLSLSNQLLVALACPDATFVAGFKAWLGLGHCVPGPQRARRRCRVREGGMSIRRKVLASDPRRPSTAGNALHSPVKLGTVPLCPSSCGGGRCEQASSHRTQYQPLHELCHALVGQGGELGGFSYGLEEVVVESATFVACASVGLATDVESVPYIAGWAGTEEPATVVREAAEAIDTLARLIEDAIAPRDEAVAA